MNYVEKPRIYESIDGMVANPTKTLLRDIIVTLYYQADFMINFNQVSWD